MFKVSASHLIDGYKADHAKQYPDGLEEVYSNLTPRSDHLASKNSMYDGRVVSFGQQAFVKGFLIDYWNETFFSKPRNVVQNQLKRRLDNYLGVGAVSIENIGELHDLGHLPLRVKALPEGVLVPMKVPLLTIRNTDRRFGWLTNRLETMMSTRLWHPVTTATTALSYRRMFDWYAKKTGFDPALVPFQGHDFSFRGLENEEAAMASGGAHLLSFLGTDTVPAIDWLEYYYGANSDKEVVGLSVPATEHSVMCAGGQLDELETFRELIQDKYPAGFISIVSDTWDFWKVLTEYLPQLKTTIMARDGRVVIRPDSGDPVKIICGDPEAAAGSPARYGAIRVLWDLFGGTITQTGHRLLDSHIGLIYGDSITLARQEEILSRLAAAGYCSGNVVLGIGSYTYQYVTRDSFGMAMKATSAVVNGKRIELFKDPATDDGKKRSARGLLRVELGDDGRYVLHDRQTEAEEQQGELRDIFVDGNQFNIQTLAEIRERLSKQ